MQRVNCYFLGTRIIYERKFLLDLKNSPLSKTPTSLPVIPGITLDDDGKVIEEVHKKAKKGNENQVPLEEHNGHDPKKAHGKVMIQSFSPRMLLSLAREFFS